jgi:hypothetical protein
MKYKVLKSMARNFSHSFVSYNNYVDGDYVIEDLRKLARAADGKRVSINWIPGYNDPVLLPERVLKSIAYYKAALPRHISSSGVHIESIREFRTNIFLKPNKQIAIEAYLLDDKGKEHVSNIYDF